MAAQIRFFAGPGGRRLAYAIDGDGPLMVLPAWWVSNVERDLADPDFADFFAQLASRVTVVRYDRAGVGLSDRARSDYTLDDELDTLMALLDELGADRTALLGMSCGGPLAVACAARHPERVSRLVLYGSYARGALLATDELKAAMVALVRASWGMGARALADVFAPDLSREGAQRFAAMQRESASAEMAAALLEMTYRLDVSELVGGVRAPTLVLHRRHDRAVGFERGRELAASIRGATFQPLEGTAHVPWVGERAALAGAVLDFVTAARPAARPAAPEAGGEACFTRDGEVWTLAFAGQRAHVKHARGLADLALLLANPGTEIHATRLMEGSPAEPPPRAAADAVLDERARAALRARLAELEREIAAAEAAGAPDALRAAAERDALLHELRAATGLHGRRRALADPDERARKAVSGRVRESIDKIRAVLPELGRHLDESISTGTFCVYAPPRPTHWRT